MTPWFAGSGNNIVMMVPNTLTFFQHASQYGGSGQDLSPFSQSFMAIGVFEATGNTHIAQNPNGVSYDVLHLMLMNHV